MIETSGSAELGQQGLSHRVRAGSALDRLLPGSAPARDSFVAGAG